MRTLSMTLFMTLLLSVGCASKKAKNSDESHDNDGIEELIVNGDSDHNKAGKIRTVYFPYNEVSFDAKAKETLKSNAEYLKENAAISIQIEGHCDERGGRQFNLALGERRAKAVRDYLKALGVNAARIQTMTWGNEKPKAEGNSEEYWSQNRRANFVITSK